LRAGVKIGRSLGGVAFEPFSGLALGFSFFESLLPYGTLMLLSTRAAKRG
jgi:hypothetical protein